MTLSDANENTAYVPALMIDYCYSDYGDNIMIYDTDSKYVHYMDSKKLLHKPVAYHTVVESDPGDGIPMEDDVSMDRCVFIVPVTTTDKTVKMPTPIGDGWIFTVKKL